MHANKPEMAKKWEKHTPKGKKLPKRVSKERKVGKEWFNKRVAAILERYSG